MSTVIVAANMGHLKAYRLVETPTRGRKLDLIDEMEFPEAHGHFADKVTDMSGRFRVSEGPGPRSTPSYGEPVRAEIENERRLFKLIAEQIEIILEDERPEYWHFAATSECHHAILNELPPELSERVVRHVQADLTRVPASEVLSHFMLTAAAT